MADVREIGPEELDRWIAVVTEADPESAGSVETQLDWRRQAEDLTWFLAEDESGSVGAAVAVVGWHSPPGIGRGTAWVAPDHRGAGAGSALYRELARWLGERGCAEMETNVREDDPASIAWSERRGFREVGRTSRLVLDLAGVQEPAVDPPAGITILSWAERPDLAPAMYAVYRESSPDVPGEEDAAVPSYEQWLSHDMEGASDRAEAVFVALAGDEVVGYAKLSLSEARADVAYHDLTAVRRAWRGRGVAGALKRAEIAWAKRKGYARLETANEERNEPIRKLNQRHGYRVEPGHVVLRTALVGID